MKTSEILRKAKALIDTEATWTTCCTARDILGLATGCKNSTAVSYCAFGALWSIDGWRSGADDALIRAAVSTFGVHEAGFAPNVVPYTPAAVNDTLGFDAVHIMYDEAIEERESQDD